MISEILLGIAETILLIMIVGLCGSLVVYFYGCIKEKKWVEVVALSIAVTTILCAVIGLWLKELGL